MDLKPRKKRALISTVTPNGLNEFERLLATDQWEIISTGGTARRLSSMCIPSKPIQNFSDFPGMMNHWIASFRAVAAAGELTDEVEENFMRTVGERVIGYGQIDLVVVEFPEFLANPSMDNMDLSRTGLVRAAVKNSKRVHVVVDWRNYSVVVDHLVETGTISDEWRSRLLVNAMTVCSTNDGDIAQWMNRQGIGIFDQSSAPTT